MALFDLQEPIHFSVPDADICLYPNFIASHKAQEYFDLLYTQTPWRNDPITVFGKTHPQPRLTSLYGHEGKPYAYANVVMQPHPWTPLLTFLKEEVEQIAHTQFTTVLLNLYRHGQDSNGWHADNEKELGRNPVIASLSFGAERAFHLQHNTLREEKLKIPLTAGSLLLMQGVTQHYWKHQIPKTARPVGPRINLTFRTLK
jgi:alkylated DNA repair dioxygenase AlkB